MKVEYPVAKTVSVWIGTLASEADFDKCVDKKVAPALQLGAPLESICEIAFEQQVARLVEAGDEVYVRVVPKYAPGATRPSSIVYQVRVNGVTTTRVFLNP